MYFLQAKIGNIFCWEKTHSFFRSSPWFFKKKSKTSSFVLLDFLNHVMIRMADWNQASELLLQFEPFRTNSKYPFLPNYVLYEICNKQKVLLKSKRMFEPFQTNSKYTLFCPIMYCMKFVKNKKHYCNQSLYNTNFQK